MHEAFEMLEWYLSAIPVESLDNALLIALASFGKASEHSSVPAATPQQKAHDEVRKVRELLAQKEMDEQEAQLAVAASEHTTAGSQEDAHPLQAAAEERQRTAVLSKMLSPDFLVYVAESGDAHLLRELEAFDALGYVHGINTMHYFTPSFGGFASVRVPQ